MEEIKRCPFCGEEILAVAIKCKHCQSMLNSQENAIQQETRDVGTQESILLDTSGNLFRGIESVSGRIVITNRAVKFSAHLLNLQRTPLEIEISDIKSVSKRNTMGFVPNGILITLKSGQEYKFVVFGRERIIDIIQKMLF